MSVTAIGAPLWLWRRIASRINVTNTAWAIVALKSPATAKSRLSLCLTELERRDLFFIMAARVINALQQTPGIARVLVVTAAAEVVQFARDLHAEILDQRRDAGTAAAFAHAIDALAALPVLQRPDSALLIAGDLPLISPTAVSSVLQYAGGGIAIVPDRQRIGTNALLCSPPGLLPPSFGGNSFIKHCNMAAALGLPVHVHESDALGLDIDVADDLKCLETRLNRLSTKPDDDALIALLRRARPMTSSSHLDCLGYAYPS